jgi:predicted kinase
VIVSGAPGAGKSTIAQPLASALGFELLSKDSIKEQLYDSLGPGTEDSLAWSRRLGTAAMHLLWDLAERFPRVVLEANFRPHSDYERSRLTEIAPVVEVHCWCPPDIAIERYARRARMQSHHPVHVRSVIDDEFLAEFDGPMAVGPVIRVDTTSLIDVRSLAIDVREAFSRSRP